MSLHLTEFSTVHYAVMWGEYGQVAFVHWQYQFQNTNKTQFNSSPPRQNGCHFRNNMFKCIFFNENIWISNKTSLKYIPWDVIDKLSAALVQIMAWHHPGDKPLSEAMLTQFTDICAALGDELTHMHKGDMGCYLLHFTVLLVLFEI